MSKYEIERPWLYDNRWLVFDNTTLSNLDMEDCNDAIEGVCYTDKTFTECVKECKDAEDEMCSAGYYVETPIGEDNYCVPLRTNSIGKKDFNPYHKLRKKSIYPVLKNINIKTFVDSKKFRFPPNDANLVFYSDRMLLENIEEKIRLSDKSIDKTEETKNIDISYVFFEKDGNLNIQFRPLVSTQDSIGEISSPIRYGDNFVIHIPGTSLVLKKNTSNNNFKWIANDTPFMEILNTSFKCVPKTRNKMIGDYMNYGDEFYILYNDLEIIVMENNIIFSNYNNYETLYENNKNVGFKLISRMKVYYCDGIECKEVPVDEIEKSGETGFYKNKHVNRNPGCWGICKYKNPKANLLDYFGQSNKQNDLIKPIYIIIGLIIFTGILLTILCIKNSK
jgi:hypothetical protein